MKWLMLWAAFLLAGCLDEFPAYVFPGPQGNCRALMMCHEGYTCNPQTFICEQEAKSDGSPPDAIPPRDGGNGDEGTDDALTDARPADAERTDADVSPMADQGQGCPRYLPEGEICDGEDNDCDGTADENLDVGAPCILGLLLGECQDGELRCEDGVTRCVSKLPPLAEQCDQRDNDCDGPIDEGLNCNAECAAGVQQPCYTGPVGTEGEGLCVGGQKTCSPGGTWGACETETLPQDEVCDGLDNDCDGRTDEDVLNLCGWCGPENIEICDGTDNDCDGIIDNVGDRSCICLPGQERDCYSGQQGTEGIGACHEGSQTCTVERSWGPCVGEVIPAPEVCDNIDNNCDRQVDELPPGPAQCFAGVGSCRRQGNPVCDAAHGPAVACEAQLGRPAAEVCDGADNDCDGNIDEDFEGIEEACSAGEGACNVEGRIVCNGPDNTTCNARPGQQEAETCNGIDDDCDGTTDDVDGLGEVCANGLGLCARQGRMVCADGPALVCDAQPGQPIGEEVACNLGDEDCDGNLDEGFNLGAPCFAGEQGICRAEGTWGCERGQRVCTAAVINPRAEVCNGVDDDCDGNTDEAVASVPCNTGLAGVCAVGETLCENGMERCDAPLPAPDDACANGRDDDCDGAIDNGPFCDCAPNEGRSCYEGPVGTEGVGSCYSGVALCDGEGGLGPCEGQGLPTADDCDTRDNDCDGSVDEDFSLGEACSVGQGACMRPGVRVCDGPNATRCNAVPGQPVAERCDNIDNDCDGVVDENLLNACGLCGPLPSETCNEVDDDCDGQTDEICPPLAAPLNGQRMFRQEVTVQGYIDCRNAVGCGQRPVAHGANPMCNWGAPGREQHPLNCLNFGAAEEVCRFYGCRIPTLEEWRRHAGYIQGENETYPWGNQPIDCARAQTMECLPIETRPVGSHPDGASISGAEDCIGSVREFTTTPTQGGILVAGCGFLESRQEAGSPPCNLSWSTGRTVNQLSPDLGVRCICDGF